MTLDVPSGGSARLVVAKIKYNANPDGIDIPSALFYLRETIPPPRLDYSVPAV
jgi:hypothetical protein